MTRRDYILLARALRRAYFAREPGMFPWAIVTEIANELAADNPRFDRNHFYAVIRGERELESKPPRTRARV